MISPDTIERIRQRVDIAQLIGESVRLERRGRSLVGLCPFHKEKTGSFHVSPERGRYHCFGCQESGDAFSFLQKTEGLSFLESVRKLAERVGVEVEDDLSDAEQRERALAKRREQALFDVNAAAATYFERMLREHPDRQSALDELRRRGLPLGGPASELLSSFRVGYAPEGWDGLVEHLRRAGLDAAAAEQVGLLAPRKSGSGHYDRFRQRLMFAVIDLAGRVVAFSGRALPSSAPQTGEPPAKYINSPESPIYQKRKTVFGLYQARQHLRAGRPCLLVEGNFDVVSLHARGFPNAVAPLGTALTEEQGRSIRRFTSDVVLLFDGDRAGREAAAKCRKPLRDAGLAARVARLPDGLDPDDFSRERGVEALEAVIAAARGMLDHLLSELLDERFLASDPESRARTVQQALELLSSEDDPTVRALAEQHADRLASHLGVADARTLRSLQSSVARSLRRREATDGAATATARSAGSREASEDAGVGRTILGALLDFPDLLGDPVLGEHASVLSGELAAAVACLHRARRSSAGAGARQSGLDLSLALANMPDAVRPFVEARLAAPRHSEVEVARAELSANLRKLKNVELSRQTSTAVSELERARSEGDFERELELLRRQADRARRRHEID